MSFKLQHQNPGSSFTALNETDGYEITRRFFIFSAAKHKLLDGFHLRHTPSLGSSGAVNGIVIFEILMMPFATILIYGVLPLPAWVLGALFLAQDINGAIGVRPFSLSWWLRSSRRISCCSSWAAIRSPVLSKRLLNLLHSVWPSDPVNCWILS